MRFSSIRVTACHYRVVTTEADRLRERLRAYEAMARVLEEPQAFLKVLLSAEDPEASADQLRERFGLDDLQVAAVLDLQFRRVTVRDRSRIFEERQRLRDELDSVGGEDST